MTYVRPKTGEWRIPYHPHGEIACQIFVIIHRLGIRPVHVSQTDMLALLKYWEIAP